MEKRSDGSSQGVRHPLHLSDALIHLTSQFDIYVCALHLAGVSSLAPFLTAALGVMSLSSCIHVNMLVLYFKDVLRLASGPALASVQTASTGSHLQGASHNQDCSPKCCAKAGFLVMMHKQSHFWVGLGTLPLCVQGANQKGNASALHVGEELALPIWFHCMSLTDVRPIGDVQNRTVEVTCHLPSFTLLFVLTPELPKQFPLR